MQIESNNSMNPHSSRLSLPNRLGSEKKAMQYVESLFEQLSLPKDRLQDVQTVVSEACLNAMEHGNGFDESTAYEVELVYEQGFLLIRVYDLGGLAKWKEEPEFHEIASTMASDKEPRGWGIAIIDSLVDTWEYHRTVEGTCLEVRVKIKSLEEDA